MVRWAGADIPRCGDTANVAARHHALITINSVTAATAGHWRNKYIFTRDFIKWTFPILFYSELLVGIVGTLLIFVHLFIPWLLFAI